MNTHCRLSSFRRIGLLIGVACFGLLSRVHAQTQDDVTVAFLYNFARFIEWPDSAYAAPNAPFTVGFLARPGLAQKFGQAVQGKNAGGRDFAIKRLDSPSDASDCQIVFVGDPSQTASVIAALNGKPVLTVGEGEAFLAQKGMIAFSREGARLVFDVNPAAISSVGMKPAEKITKAARSTKGG